MRVASLLPSTTETVHALDMAAALVGRSHECDHPASAAALPVLTAARLDASRPGAAIDRDVRRLVRDALSIYEVDAERLRDLRPNVVLTQSRCEVCAVTERDVERALADWSGTRPRIVSLAPGDLDSVWGDLARVAQALGVPERGEALVAACRERVEQVCRRVAGRPAPRVLCLEWIDPPMAAGHWVPELVRAAGGEPLFGEAGEPARWLEWPAVAEADPDMIVAMPCGFDLARTRREMAVLADMPEWRALRAVRAGRVCLTDGNAYFNRPGPRLAESAEILAEILHPEACPRAHSRGTWQGDAR